MNDFLTKIPELEDSLELSLDNYQEKAIEFAVYPRTYSLEGIYYCILGLVGEGGELANKFKKVLRDNNKVLTQETIDDLILELGDVLWYVANVAEELNINLSKVAIRNLKKLQNRKTSNTIKGVGDNR